MSRSPGTAEIHVARRLAALREESGLTLRDVAGRSGLSEAYLNRVEREKTPIKGRNSITCWRVVARFTLADKSSN